MWWRAVLFSAPPRQVKGGKNLKKRGRPVVSRPVKVKAKRDFTSESVAAVWDDHATLRQNYAALGLAVDASVGAVDLSVPAEAVAQFEGGVLALLQRLRRVVSPVCMWVYAYVRVAGRRAGAA